MNKKFFYFCALTAATLTSCTDNDVSQYDSRYSADFEKAIGGKIDPSQTWVTGTVISAEVKTSGEATVRAYTLGKETRVLYAEKDINGSGTFTFGIPQNLDTRIAFEADYGDAEKVYRKMDLTLALTQKTTIDLSRGATTRAMAESNSVPNPPASLCGSSNQSTEDGYAGHHFGYTSFPGWTWDNLAQAVPEANGTKPHERNQITNYELISTGQFYLCLLYGCTGTYYERTLGYYYYKEQGKYDDLVMVDLLDVLSYDYIDDYAKVQYQLMGQNTWMDTNFDYKDGDGLTANKATTSIRSRVGDNAFNTLLVNKEYGGENGIQGIRGLTFQINVPVGYRLGFYLRCNTTNNDQKEALRSLGIAEKYLTGKATCFSGADLNIKTAYKYRSIIQKFDGYTFMGLEDNPTGGDYDSNDVTFGLTAGNGGSLPGVLLPGVQDLDTKKYYNNDGTITDEPKESYVQNVIEGRDPDDFGPSTTPGEGEEEQEVIPSVKDLPAWTFGFEDMGMTGDFDFNDVVLKVVPNTANRAKIYICAAGGSLDAGLHYEGPSGDINFGSIHQYMPSMTNTNGKITQEPVLVGEVSWPDGFTMPTDAYRFYITVKGERINVNTTPGQAPKAICVQGDWQWPLENISLITAYGMLTKWATNINDAEVRDWYKHPNKTQVVSFE